MGNREEIIKGKTYLSLIKGEQKIILIHDDVINAMQEYSDQQNKQLLEEIEQLKSKVSNWMDKYIEVNEENKKLQSELKDCTENYNHYVDKCFKLESELKDKERVNEGLQKLVLDIQKATTIDFSNIHRIMEIRILLNNYLTNQNK